MKKLLLTNLFIAMSLPALAFAPFTLNKVEIDGVNKGQEQDILKLLNLSTGQKVSENDVAKIVKTLYGTGNFDNVTVDKKNNDLDIKVALKPRIASLNFKGNSLIPTDQIRKTYEENNIKQGSPVNQDVIDNLNVEVEKFYQAQGYSQVSVNTRYQTLSDGTVNVTIFVDEKKKAYLKTLVLSGNKSFSQSEILSNSVVRPDQSWYNFYHNSNFNSQNKQLLLDNISDFYKNRGYAKFKVLDSNTIAENPEKPENMTFYLEVEEGSIYKVSSVSFFTRNDSLKTSLVKYNTIAKGSVYNQSRVSSVIEEAKNYLKTLGYAQAKIEPVLQFNDQNKTVEVLLAVEPGNRYSVAQINFSGNVLTRDNVIRRELSQQENAIYNLNKVNDDIASLYRTGFFSEVSYDVKPVAGTTDQLDLTYKLKEASNGKFQIGLGYGDSQGLTFTSKFSQNNFLGTGRNFGLDVSKSLGKFSASVDFTEPYITTSGISLSTSLFYSNVNTEKFKSYNGYKYKQEVAGLNLGTGFNVSKYGSVNFSVGYERNKYENLYPEFYRALYLNSIGQGLDKGKWVVKTHDITLNAGYRYNTYNRYLFPTKGLDFSLRGSYTGIASTDKYGSITTSLRTYLPLNDANTFVLGTRSSFSYAKSFEGKYLPINALYSVGGFGTLRGINYGSVGPVAIYCPYGNNCSTKNPKLYTSVSNDSIGGNMMAAGGVDLIFPLFRGEIAKSVRTSFFLDTAAAWSSEWKKYTADLDQKMFAKLEDYSKPNFRVTYGVSLEWQSPLGLLSFNIAKPLKKRDYDNSEVFSINFGGNY